MLILDARILQNLDVNASMNMADRKSTCEKEKFITVIHEMKSKRTLSCIQRTITVHTHTGTTEKLKLRNVHNEGTRKEKVEDSLDASRCILMLSSMSF